MLSQKLFNPEISMVYLTQMKPLATEGWMAFVNSPLKKKKKKELRTIINPWNSQDEDNNIYFYILTHIFLHLD